MKLAPRGAAAALSVAALVISFGVGAAAATAAVAPAPAATTSSSTTATTTDRNVVRTWTFEDGKLTGITGVGGASVAIDASARRGGALGLHVGQAANYGAGFKFQFDTAGLADGWYDLWLPVRLKTGNPIRMQATGAGQTVPPVWANTDWTAGPSLHFQKFATTTRVSVNVASLKLCPGDPASPPAEFAVDDITLWRSGTQGPKPYPTVGCTATTTTPPVTTTTTTTGTTITPGGLVRHWDFGRDGSAGWSPLSGTTLGTQPDPAGGTDLVVSGAGPSGSGATLTIDAADLRDDTWYDLVVDLRLPAGTRSVLFKIWANGSGGPAAVVSDSAWRPVNVHFRKRAGQTTITADVTVQTDCSAELGFTGTFLIAGASLYQASTQAEITYTTTGCPSVTTTTSVTTSPGTVLKSWDFGTSDLAAWSPYQGTTLGTRADPAGGTDLVVSGAGAYGSGTTVMIDGSNLVDNTWYQLGMALRLPAGSPTTLYRAQAPGAWDRAGTVTDSSGSVGAHFRKLPGQTQIPVNIFSITDCAADTTHAPDTFLVSGASLKLSPTQYEVTWTTTGCPSTTTTRPVTTTTTTTTTSPTASPVQCRVLYSESRWAGGFQGNIALTNTGSTTLSDWTLTFILSSGQVQNAWPIGWFGQTGTLVTLRAPTWSPDLGPGQSVQLGFVAGGTGTVSDFRLNAVPCSGGAVTSTTSYNNNS